MYYLVELKNNIAMKQDVFVRPTTVPSAGAFRKAIASVNNRKCVEVAIEADCVAVKDSKDTTDSIVYFSRDQWTIFIAAARNGTFDYQATPVNINQTGFDMTINQDGMVHIKNSLDPEVTHKYTQGEWEAFLDGVRNGEFDLLSV